MVSDRELAEHLARALVLYSRAERANGRQVPPELLDLARFVLSASVRQEATKLGEARRAAHDERMGSELVSKREAARSLGVSVRTLERLVAAGELSVVRVGRSVRVTRADLAAYVARRRTTFRDAVEVKEEGAA